MKKVLLIIIVSLASLCAYAQSNDSISNKFMYCELVGTSNMLGTKVRVEVDFGQEVSFFKQYEQRILKDEQGNPLKFNSMVDALNYMGSLGWEFCQAYEISSGGSHVYHWLLKRKYK